MASIAKIAWAGVVVAALWMLSGEHAVAVVTKQHPTTIKAGSNLSCRLITAIDSATANSGDEFTLVVIDPRYPQAEGAAIVGHITHVHQPQGPDRARIDFLFDTITFSSGLKEPFRAYVVSADVVRHTAAPPAPPQQVGNPISGMFTPKPSTIAWQTTLGPKKTHSASSGGYAYATSKKGAIVASVGTPVTLQLASDLHTP